MIFMVFLIVKSEIENEEIEISIELREMGKVDGIKLFCKNGQTTYDGHHG